MVDQSLAKSFESVGADYDRYRPGFPDESLAAIVAEPVACALDLGAGTGKFTGLLMTRADRVVAVEPSDAMREVLRTNLPAVESLYGTAESIPVPDASVDVVTVAQAFHWFDRERACAEIARVLVGEGILGLLWNTFDPTCEWDLAAHRVAHPAVTATDETTTSVAAALPGFEFSKRESIRWTERIDRADYMARWLTVSTLLAADPDSRAAMIRQIEIILDSDAETSDAETLELPHITEVFVYRKI